MEQPNLHVINLREGSDEAIEMPPEMHGDNQYLNGRLSPEAFTTGRYIIAGSWSFNEADQGL